MGGDALKIVAQSDGGAEPSVLGSYREVIGAASPVSPEIQVLNDLRLLYDAHMSSRGGSSAADGLSSSAFVRLASKCLPDAAIVDRASMDILFIKECGKQKYSPLVPSQKSLGFAGFVGCLCGIGQESGEDLE